MKLLLRMTNGFTFVEAPPLFIENAVSLVMDMVVNLVYFRKSSLTSTCQSHFTSDFDPILLKL